MRPPGPLLHPLSPLQVESSSVLHRTRLKWTTAAEYFISELLCALLICARVQTNKVNCAHNLVNYVRCKCRGEQRRTHLGGGRGQCALRLHHPLATDTVAPSLLHPPVNKKLTMFAGLFFSCTEMCSLAISLYCRLMSIGVSADRAGDGLFMAFLMRAIIQKMPGTREKVYNG